MIDDLAVTHHFEARMRQRGFRNSDITLLFTASTQTGNAVFELTGRDAEREIGQLKREIREIERRKGASRLTGQEAARETGRRKQKIQTLERLKGSRMIIIDGVFVTCYHAIHTRGWRRGYYK